MGGLHQEPVVELDPQYQSEVLRPFHDTIIRHPEIFNNTPALRSASDWTNLSTKLITAWTQRLISPQAVNSEQYADKIYSRFPVEGFISGARMNCSSSQVKR
jgi:hypothetical protein